MSCILPVLFTAGCIEGLLTAMVNHPQTETKVIFSDREKTIDKNVNFRSPITISTFKAYKSIDKSVKKTHEE